MRALEMSMRSNMLVWVILASVQVWAAPPWTRGGGPSSQQRIQESVMRSQQQALENRARIQESIQRSQIQAAQDRARIQESVNRSQIRALEDRARIQQSVQSGRSYSVPYGQSGWRPVPTQEFSGGWSEPEVIHIPQGRMVQFGFPNQEQFVQEGFVQEGFFPVEELPAPRRVKRKENAVAIPRSLLEKGWIPVETAGGRTVNYNGTDIFPDTIVWKTKGNQVFQLNKNSPEFREAAEAEMELKEQYKLTRERLGAQFDEWRAKIAKDYPLDAARAEKANLEKWWLEVGRQIGAETEKHFMTSGYQPSPETAKKITDFYSGLYVSDLKRLEAVIQGLEKLDPSLKASHEKLQAKFRDAAVRQLVRDEAIKLAQPVVDEHKKWASEWESWISEQWPVVKSSFRKNAQGEVTTLEAWTKRETARFSSLMDFRKKELDRVSVLIEKAQGQLKESQSQDQSWAVGYAEIIQKKLGETFVEGEPSDHVSRPIQDESKSEAERRAKVQADLSRGLQQQIEKHRKLIDSIETAWLGQITLSLDDTQPVVETSGFEKILSEEKTRLDGEISQWTKIWETERTRVAAFPAAEARFQAQVQKLTLVLTTIEGAKNYRIETDLKRKRYLAYRDQGTWKRVSGIGSAVHFSEGEKNAVLITDQVLPLEPSDLERSRSEKGWLLLVSEGRVTAVPKLPSTQVRLWQVKPQGDSSYEVFLKDAKSGEPISEFSFVLSAEGSLELGEGTDTLPGEIAPGFFRTQE